ncbi:HAMP domain-containing protein [Photobacterium sanctipauli]|uniref:histidine kinase n=1 Tax=Photobacterium sanctipauli TaxID=1342794 RepID=A0A2T3NUZ1_9GAMM|nr:histidine kinase sensor domain-containing protein [Photobacterium sanctipauli]PSW20093.1 HAMP domain-containing protein [Photobacterium sanctipauli]
MAIIRFRQLRAHFGLDDRGGLAFKLFSYFAVSLFLILILQNIAEAAMVRALLRIPERIQTEMLDLAYQAEVMINEGDMDELADWERGQKYSLHVITDTNTAISGRTMHPHFEFKLSFTRSIDTIFDNRVSQPIIGIPLTTGHHLVIQFPYQYHPAKNFAYYFLVIKFVIAVLILAVFSVLLARYLKTPLDKLQQASHQLAEGDFSVRVSHAVGNTVTEFSSLACSFDHMTQRIEDLAEKQRRLIRDVSHELKTPLARHDLALHLLRKKLPEESQPLLAKLERESDEMNELVSEILEFSRLENASYDANLQPVDLVSLCRYQVLELQDMLKPGQTLSFIGNNVDTYALADHRLVLRAVKNLVGNAVKYAGEQACICVEVKDTGHGVLINVEDDGQGIKQQHLQSVFDPFTRLESSREKRTGGSGLGLAIVREAMLVMRGEATAKNLDAGGFQVSLWFYQAQ